LAAKANGTAIQTPDPTFSKATLRYYRLELRRFGSICVQLAGQRAILTDITSRRAARLPVERRKLRAPPTSRMRATTCLRSSSKPDAWTLAMDVVVESRRVV
jgi:hypothetical protein